MQSSIQHIFTIFGCLPYALSSTSPFVHFRAIPKFSLLENRPQNSTICIAFKRTRLSGGAIFGSFVQTCRMAATSSQGISYCDCHRVSWHLSPRAHGYFLNHPDTCSARRTEEIARSSIHPSPTVFALDLPSKKDDHYRSRSCQAIRLFCGKSRRSKWRSISRLSPFTIEMIPNQIFHSLRILRSK
jgi:hypothetical protein